MALGDIGKNTIRAYKAARIFFATATAADSEVVALADFGRDQLAARRKEQFEHEHKLDWFSGELHCRYCYFGWKDRDSTEIDPRHDFTEERWQAAAHEELSK